MAACSMTQRKTKRAQSWAVDVKRLGQRSVCPAGPNPQATGLGRLSSGP